MKECNFISLAEESGTGSIISATGTFSTYAYFSTYKENKAISTGKRVKVHQYLRGRETYAHESSLDVHCYPENSGAKGNAQQVLLIFQ